MKNKEKVQKIKEVIKLIKKDWGANCKTSDFKDFPKFYKKPKDVFNNARCGSCRAKEVIEWLKYWLKFSK